jgi:GR25 family glycosyltransferase involved in LPS biosynthesis
MGAALSHYMVWRGVATGKHDYCLVLEDDVVFTEEFSNRYNQVLDILKLCPHPFVFLGYNMSRKISYPQLVQTVTAGEDVTTETINKVSIVSMINNSSGQIWGGTHGYIIHKDFAKKLVSIVEQDGIQEPIDMFVLKQKGLYEVIPQIVSAQQALQVENIDTDIQNDWLSVYDNYVFIKNKDVLYNDIKKSDVTGYQQLRVAEFVKEADETPECVAFNSFGYLKSKLVSPTNLDTIRCNTNGSYGLYIKMIKGETYDFYPYLDSPGSTYCALPPGITDPTRMKDIANQEVRCAAFNTNGELKTSITDIKDFVLIGGREFDDIEGTEGLYVKRLYTEVFLNNDDVVVIHPKAVTVW